MFRLSWKGESRADSERRARGNGKAHVGCRVPIRGSQETRCRSAGDHAHFARPGDGHPATPGPPRMLSWWMRMENCIATWAQLIHGTTIGRLFTSPIALEKCSRSIGLRKGITYRISPKSSVVWSSSVFSVWNANFRSGRCESLPLRSPDDGHKMAECAAVRNSMTPEAV